MVFLRILHLSGFSSAYIQTPTTSHLSLLLSWFLNTPERSPCSTLAPLQRTLCQTPKRFTDTYRSDWCPLSSSSPVVFLFCILLWLRAPRDSVSASSPYPALVLYSRAPGTLALTAPSTCQGYAHLRASARPLSTPMATAHDNHSCSLMPSSSTFSDLSV